MVSRADTVGVFQIESRAQMSMLPRLRPRCFYDLVIEVAIVRPGPIQGDMVHPYLRRRDGTEPEDYPNEAIRAVLGKTLGVPLFQEQAMALAVVAAGFTPGEADQLRRAIAAWKRSGNQIARFGEKLIGGMRARGYGQRFAEQVFGQIQGFSGYGFPESHAASFAMLVYVSAWLKRHHPAAFTAALLNSQPMGFYAPAQLVRDAREHGVEVRPVDVLRSAWDCSLEDGAEAADAVHVPRTTHDPHGPPASHAPQGPADWGSPGPALRLGLRMVAGLREEDGRAVVDTARAHGTTDGATIGTRNGRFAGGIHLHEVWMIQSGSRDSLVVEAGNKLCIGRERRLEGFDRNNPPENGLAGLVDGTQASLAEFGQNLELTEALSVLKHRRKIYSCAYLMETKQKAS
jgi:error-prone DNA polymerase